MITALKRRNRPRRGVTLVEMLVVVALVVLMMVILVQIFQSALGAMSASRTTQELDVVLRSVDSIIRSDLAGVTAKMTPPNIPSQKTGYFVYGENAPADLQGEDTDDYLAFTTKAPEGQVFTGRQWLSKLISSGANQVQTINQSVQPATVSSQVAEVLYFMRNGNLYRRVFLVAPERKGSIVPNGPTFPPSKQTPQGIFQTSMFGSPLNVSWQGMNDVSCRPGGYSNLGTPLTPIPNDLGDLTNRENRIFSPRFLNDFNLDGIPDDFNSDNIPDYYPTLYFDGNGVVQKNASGQVIGWAPCGNNSLCPLSGVHESIPYPQTLPQRAQPSGSIYDVYAFPFIYPGMYSVPDPNRVNNPLGWVHYVPPNQGNGTLPATGYLNHAPLDLGETPGFAPGTLPTFAQSNLQTWFGFPTWRETMARVALNGSINDITGWTDPVYFVTNPGISINAPQQPVGLKPFPPRVTPSLTDPRFPTRVIVPGSGTTPGTGTSPYAYDTAGANSLLYANPANPSTLWEDEQLLSNVRSFDVKAYDPDAPLYNPNVGTYLSAGYWDLGYAGLSPSTYAPNYASTTSTIYGPNGKNYNVNSQFGPPVVLFQAIGGEPTGFGHEGRIPPYTGDFRMHPRRGYNIGDDNPGVIRLTHTFDTWSTDYVNAPDSDILYDNFTLNTPSIYPSFPPPYPSPLRGIQIQVRVTDPRNERTKVLTIRHDFTDKL
jgi:type II secretory pathway pseudopilin PulG